MVQLSRELQTTADLDEKRVFFVISGYLFWILALDDCVGKKDSNDDPSKELRYALHWARNQSAHGKKLWTLDTHPFEITMDSTVMTIATAERGFETKFVWAQAGTGGDDRKHRKEKKACYTRMQGKAVLATCARAVVGIKERFSSTQRDSTYYSSMLE